MRNRPRCPSWHQPCNRKTAQSWLSQPESKGRYHRAPQFWALQGYTVTIEQRSSKVTQGRKKVAQKILWKRFDQDEGEGLGNENVTANQTLEKKFCLEKNEKNLQSWKSWVDLMRFELKLKEIKYLLINQNLTQRTTREQTWLYNRSSLSLGDELFTNKTSSWNYLGWGGGSAETFLANSTLKATSSTDCTYKASSLNLVEESLAWKMNIKEVTLNLPALDHI